MVTPLKEILRAAARRMGIEAVAYLVEAQAAWPRVVGPALAAESAPVRLRKGLLLVGVSHPATGHEIRLRQAEILVALAREIGEGAVTSIRPVGRRRLPRR